MKDALTKLIKVKTIVTIMITVVFVILALKGTVTPEYVMTIVTTVIAFYFGTQTEKKSNAEEVTTTTEAIAEDTTPTAIEEPTVTLYNNTAEEPEQTAEETEK